MQTKFTKCHDDLIKFVMVTMADFLKQNICFHWIQNDKACKVALTLCGLENSHGRVDQNCTVLM